MSQLPKISIITVVFNDKAALQKTVKSIKEQTYPNIEYVVIDGNSKDDTVEVIKANQSSIDYWVSEPDKGLFHAMNKGIEAATGKWLNFMNAGDVFVTPDTISKCFETSHEGVALIYGDTFMGSERRLEKPFSLERIKGSSMIACHQSMFYNAEILGEELKYNLTFNRRCDHELLMRMYKKGFAMKYIELPVAWFNDHGISGQLSWQARISKFYYSLKYFGLEGLMMGVSDYLKVKRKH